MGAKRKSSALNLHLKYSNQLIHSISISVQRMQHQNWPLGTSSPIHTCNTALGCGQQISNLNRSDYVGRSDLGHRPASKLWRQIAHYSTNFDPTYPLRENVGPSSRPCGVSAVARAHHATNPLTNRGFIFSFFSPVPV